jgi:hypothetical protein
MDTKQCWCCVPHAPLPRLRDVGRLRMDLGGRIRAHWGGILKQGRTLFPIPANDSCLSQLTGSQYLHAPPLAGYSKTILSTKYAKHRRESPPYFSHLDRVVCASLWQGQVDAVANNVTMGRRHTGGVEDITRPENPKMLPRTARRCVIKPTRTCPTY